MKCRKLLKNFKKIAEMHSFLKEKNGVSAARQGGPGGGLGTSAAELGWGGGGLLTSGKWGVSQAPPLLLFKKTRLLQVGGWVW